MASFLFCACDPNGLQAHGFFCHLSSAFLFFSAKEIAQPRLCRFSDCELSPFSGSPFSRILDQSSRGDLVLSSLPPHEIPLCERGHLLSGICLRREPSLARIFRLFPFHPSSAAYASHSLLRLGEKGSCEALASVRFTAVCRFLDRGGDRSPYSQERRGKTIRGFFPLPGAFGMDGLGGAWKAVPEYSCSVGFRFCDSFDPRDFPDSCASPGAELL